MGVSSTVDEVASASPGVPGVSSDPVPSWRRLSAFERLITALALILVVAVAVPRVVYHIYPGDPGDLQTAAAVWGIAHPPGYGGYALVLGLLCRVFFFAEPAAVVSAACCACMVASVWLLIVLLVRIGLHVAIAAAGGLLLTTKGTVWLSTVLPEVYAPSLLLLMAAAYVIFKYGRLRRRGDLAVAALLFGMLVANRPVAALYAPGFLAALWAVERGSGATVWAIARRTALTISLAVIPVVISVAYVWVRDAPSNPYNYITQYAEVQGGLPDTGERVGDRFRRVSWIVTARQYVDQLTADPKSIRTRIRGIRRALDVAETVPLLCALVILAVGTVVLSLRGARYVLPVFAVLTGQGFYLLVYVVYGRAADVLPMVFMGTLLIGAALATLAPRDPVVPWPKRTRVVVFAAVCVWLAHHVSLLLMYPARGPGGQTINMTLIGLLLVGAAVMLMLPATARRLRHVTCITLLLVVGALVTWKWATNPSLVDATGTERYLAELDMATLPEGTVIVADWGTSRRLWYEKLVNTNRDDIKIITAKYASWPELADRYADRVVLVDLSTDPPPGYRMLPWRNLWRLERAAGEGE